MLLTVAGFFEDLDFLLLTVAGFVEGLDFLLLTVAGFVQQAVEDSGQGVEAVNVEHVLGVGVGGDGVQLTRRLTLSDSDCDHVDPFL